MNRALLSTVIVAATLLSTVALTKVQAQPMASAAPEASKKTPVSDGYVDECQVIARVDGQVMLACEVLWQVNREIESKGGQLPPGQEKEIFDFLMQRQLVSNLDTKILYANFRRNAPMADLAAIHSNLDKIFDEKEIPELMKMVGVKERDQLEDKLLSLGTTLAERREGYYEKMIARSWINESLEFNREVTHQQMLDYYRDHGEDFDFPTQARWEELMIRFDKHESKDAAYRTLVSLGSAAFQLTKNAVPSEPIFSDLAKQSSDGFTAEEGGQHDWTTQGSLAAERVDEALFLVPIGQMSPIIEGNRGFHIVRVLERKLAGRKPFTEVQNTIREKIQNDRFSEAIQSKIVELRSNARIWTVYEGDFKHPAAQQGPRQAAKPGTTQR